MEKNLEAAASLPSGIVGFFKSELEKRKKKPTIILSDVLLFAACFVFARWHMLFGAYPLAVAFIAALPSGVWIALLGALIGSLSLGKMGIIHAMITLIVVFLRVLISGGVGKDGEGRVVFSENILLRCSSALVGAFIGSVYELLLEGFGRNTVLYSLVSCFATIGFCAVFWGLFSADISFHELVFGKRAIFEKKKKDRDAYKPIMFQTAFLVLVFALSLALSEYSLFGINADFVFAGVITLFAAKRFGAVRAMAVGFVASLGVSSTYSVAFALLGLGAGLLFPFGHLYAMVGGGALLSAWCAYTGGLVGFLSVFPEYAAAIAIFFPFVRVLTTERREENTETANHTASDMVASVAFSRRNGISAAESLSSALFSSVPLLKSLGRLEGDFTREEIRDFLLPSLREGCAECAHFKECIKINPAPCIEILDELSTNIYKNNMILKEDEKILPSYCVMRDYLMSHLTNGFVGYSMQKHKSRNLTELAEEYELMARLISEAADVSERERALDKPLSEKLETALIDAGLSGGVIRAFGDRCKRFIVAGEDESGTLVSSQLLFDGIRDISGYKLGTPEYFRRGSVALMDSYAAPLYTVDFAKSSSCAENSPASGDSVLSFTSSENYFFSLISDGMGSGELAASGSRLASEFMSTMLSAGISEVTAVHLLNHIIRQRAEESSVALDLFRFDLLRGEAIFLKSGAAPSFVKREGSLYKIRTESAPLGIMHRVDAEKIRVDCAVGDLIIMLSDGVSDSHDTSLWLAELLSKPAPHSLQEYADEILAAAKKNAKTNDDMTVSVARIRKLSA